MTRKFDPVPGNLTYPLRRMNLGTIFAAPTPTAEHERAYALHLDQGTRARLRIAGGLIAALMVVGGAIAWATRPNAPWEGQLARVVTFVVAIGVAAFARHPRSERRGVALAFVLCLVGAA